jgi:hypothetical protein
LQNAEEVELRKSYKIRGSTILNDYVVYLQEFDVDVGHKDDPKLFFHMLWVEITPHCGSIPWNKRWNPWQRDFDLVSTVLLLKFISIYRVFYFLFLFFVALLRKILWETVKHSLKN